MRDIDRVVFLIEGPVRGHGILSGRRPGGKSKIGTGMDAKSKKISISIKNIFIAKKDIASHGRSVRKTWIGFNGTRRFLMTSIIGITWD